MLLPLCYPLRASETGWNKTYGGTGDDQAQAVIEASNGGYLLAGFTNSSGAGGYDAWLIKTDDSGNLQWEKKYGGAMDDKAFDVVQTSDGGFVFAGMTDYDPKTNSYPAWLVKTDSSGNVQWSKKYSETRLTNSLVQASDGGYLIGTSSQLIKTDAMGNVQWRTQYEEEISSVAKTQDGGYVLVGAGYWTQDEGWKACLIKVDSSGNKEFNQIYGSGQNGRPNSVATTDDGGFVFAGSILEKSSQGGSDTLFWLVKTDSAGAIEWSEKFHGPGENNGATIPYSVIQTNDGGYVLAGETNPYSLSGSSEYHGPFWLVKTDSTGTMQWNQMYQGSGYNSKPFSVIQTTDGGFAIAGFDGSLYLNNGVQYIGDVWLIKTDENGLSPGLTSEATSPSPSQAPTQTETPVWAFNGAYATYEATAEDSGSVIGLQVTMAIKNVNSQEQTFDASYTYNGSFTDKSFSQEKVSFAKPVSFVMSIDDLALINSGHYPSGDYSNIKVTPKILQSVPAGTFLTDELNLVGNGTMWIDMYSGLLVKATEGLRLTGITLFSDFQLVETNICSETSANTVTFKSGTATFDDSAVTGVRVEISDSQALEGVSVDIIVTYFGTELPPTAGTFEIAGAGFYDVQIISDASLSQDATATIYLTNSAFTSKDYVLFYWNGNSWVECYSSFNPPNTIIGSISANELTGTFITVGTKTASGAISIEVIIVIAVVLLLVVLAFAVFF
jgi:hypothetical protein